MAIVRGYKRPIDRPSKIWCAVCEQYKSHKRKELDSGTWPPPSLETWSDGECGTTGAMKFEYDDGTPEEPLWKPVCGDPHCVGGCNDLRCIPPRKEIVKVEEKQIVAQKVGVDPIWKLSTFIFVVLDCLYLLQHWGH